MAHTDSTQRPIRVGDTIWIRRPRFEKRRREFIVREIREDGTLVGDTHHKAARGGSWVSTRTIVRPNEVVSR